MDLKGIKWEVMDWIQLTQDRDKKWDFINTVMNFFTNLIFVFPCIIIYGFIKTSLMQIVECYFITLPPLYMFRMPYTSILRSVI